RLAHFAEARPDILVAAEAIACILYTSGSAGLPKGVYQNQRNILHHISNYTNSAQIASHDRLSLLAPFSFAASLTNLFGALLNGASLHPFDVKRHGFDKLAVVLAEQRVT